jgi:hypothetical protein
MKLRKPSNLVVNWVSSCLSFFLSASAAATYIFTALTCTTTTIISLEPCALDAEFQHFVLRCNISYWDLIKCPYFADSTERGDRGWKEAQRQGEDRVSLWITLLWDGCRIWLLEGHSTYAWALWVPSGARHQSWDDTCHVSPSYEYFTSFQRFSSNNFYITCEGSCWLQRFTL